MRSAPSLSPVLSAVLALASCADDPGTGGADGGTGAAASTGAGTDAPPTTGATPAGSTSQGGATDGQTGGGSSESSAAEGSSGDEPPQPVWGYADLHLHMMAEEAFGGGWLYGRHAGPQAAALAACDGGFPGDHARLRADLTEQFMVCQDEDLPLGLDVLTDMIPLLDTILFAGGVPTSELIGTIEGTDGDTGLHQNRKAGAPEFGGWPRWDTIAHQQAWEGWLQQAHADGLRVVVMSAVSFDWLCTALPPDNVERPQCDEMDDVKVQLQMAHDLAAQHDWLDIALSAEQAREIAASGKLAMILSIEASSIFGDGDWLAGLDEVYALGVRSLQLVHQLDNRFGGAAPHNAIFHIAQFSRSCHVDLDCGLTAEGVTLGFDVDADCKNVRGLSEEGEALAEEMIARGMLIDGAHLSERSLEDLFAVAEAHDYYPVHLSHGHFREIMTPEKQREEKTTPAWVIAAVRRSGGVFGLRTAHEEVNTYPGGGVENSCHGSSRSLAQALQFGAQGLKVPLALGTDFNGFIQQTRPRFGDTGACSATFDVEVACGRRDQREQGPAPLGSDLDEYGFAHIGLLGDLVTDLEHLGVDTGPLANSAEATIKMWERAEGARSGPADDAADLDAGGVVAVSREDREAAFPQVCGTPYCPGAYVAGQACAFDEECSSGQCSSGPCGIPKGKCQ
mgnify:CR=1 FL=1